MLDSWKMVEKQSEAFHAFLWRHFFPSLKQNFIAYRSFKVSDCIFEIHPLWQSGFSRLYFNSCCSCSFKPEIIKIGQSSYDMNSNNILNYQESTTILNAHTKKKSENLLYAPRTLIYQYLSLHIFLILFLSVIVYFFISLSFYDSMYVHIFHSDPNIYIYIYIYIYIIIRLCR